MVTINITYNMSEESTRHAEIIIEQMQYYLDLIKEWK
jgi:hypothetical protein